MEFLLGGGGQSSDLNDSFAATTPANKPVFKKVFGDTTTWETEVGVMTFSFVFDPKAAYDQGAIMASAWSDPFSAFQEEVQRHLLNPDDLAPMASEEEVVWQHIRNNVPSELLAKHVTSIDSYLEMLTNRAKKEYHELVEFTDALKTRAFDFAVAIAIDAYPVPKAKRRSRSSSPSEDENGGPKGVVTLHIKHTLGKAGSSDDEAAAGATNGDVTGNSLSPVRRERSMSNASDDSVDFATTHLPGHLELGEGVSLRSTKKFPRDASDFFTEVEAWFNATIKKRTSEIVEALDMGANLYN